MRLRMSALIAGLVCVSVGCWFIFPPLAAIVFGLALMAFGLFSEGI